ncbi:ATP-binding protein [Streptomyces sp. NBC_00094]|uniref:ATP-binding protein n=1 Tax=Streptomyces sp. NBC_00094 TaxID=2903620 RepID=UPI0022592588|nr:ATP-binding protein [Streptomyces sp. NBC_00094]MCX5392542.1 ATP-binding protein [Streptomyces sp. NBC_00094]
MNIDPTQPWGVAIDYAGRAAVTENGHTLDVRVYDNSFGGPLEQDPMTGEYPSVYVSAQVTEAGTADAALRGSGLIVVNGQGGSPVVPDPSAVERAVAAALADFAGRRDAYAALCATWAPPAPAPAPAPQPEPEPDPAPAPEIPEQTPESAA